jgi:hypothetical protein
MRLEEEEMHKRHLKECPPPLGEIIWKDSAFHLKPIISLSADGAEWRNKHLMSLISPLR